MTNEDRTKGQLLKELTSLRAAHDQLRHQAEEWTAEIARTREDLKRSEGWYRRLVETAQEGVWVIDAEAKTSFVNIRMADMLGYTPEEMQGQSLFAFMDEEARPLAEAEMARRREGINVQLDFRFRRKDGADFWGLVAANRITDKEGNYVGALAMITDITKRKRSEQALQESHELLKQMSAALDDALFVVEPSTRTITACNLAVQRMFGYDEAALAWRSASGSWKGTPAGSGWNRSPAGARHSTSPFRREVEGDD